MTDKSPDKPSSALPMKGYSYYADVNFHDLTHSEALAVGLGGHESRPRGEALVGLILSEKEDRYLTGPEARALGEDLINQASAAEMDGTSSLRATNALSGDPLEFWGEPTSVRLHGGPDTLVTHVAIATGSREDSPVPRLVLRVGDLFALEMAPSEALAISAALSSVDSNDEGHSLSTSPRAGQTFPVSSPLDTLKHTVLGVISLLDVALDRLDGQDEEVAELLDAIKVEVLTGLREHVPGVNPRGNGEGPFPHPLSTILGDEPRGHFPTAETAQAALTYDNGAPIRLLVKDGGTVHTVMPRLQYRSTAVKADASDAA